MLIVCPSCATSYQVDPSSLGATGRSVRCVRCRKVWFVSNSAALTDIARAHRDDLNAYASENLASETVDGAPEASAADPPAAEDTAPGVVPPDASAEPPGELPPVEVLVRDDRGPALRPEPRDEPAAAVRPTIEEAPALAPQSPDSAQPAIEAASPREDVETVAARRFKPTVRRRSRWPVPSLSTTILLLLAIDAGLIGFRGEIARVLPQTASLYAAIGLPVNLRGLEFTDLVTRKDTQDGVQMLLVEGAIKSHSRRTAEVPRIRFAVRNAAGQEIYSWTALPARNAIAPGATMPFRSRLASPPSESHEVLVRFFHRRDLVAGIQ